MQLLRQFLFAATMAGLVAVAGCSKPSASTAFPKEVRGQPINQASPEAAKPAANPPVSVPTPAVAASSSTSTTDEYLTVGFDKLAGFNYDMPDETTVNTNALAKPSKEQIPQDVKVLDHKKVALKGFMLPLKVEGGLITELLIMRDQSMCCYGTVPKITEWVSVKMVGKGVKPIMDQAVTLYGSLKVGEMYENGYLVGIYQLDGEKMDGPLDL